jgi:hypothetical protein
MVKPSPTRWGRWPEGPEGAGSEKLDAQPLDALAKAADRLAHEDLMAMPGSELCAGLERLRCDIDGLEAEFSRRVSVLDRTQAYTEGGYLNAASWLFHRCNFSQSTAWDRVKTARRLSSEFAATAKAFAHGAISHLHASLICRTVEKVGLEAAQKAEPDLLDAALQLDPFRLRRVTQVLEHC